MTEEDCARKITLTTPAYRPNTHPITHTLTKASDVEDANVVGRGGEGDAVVDAPHDVVEEFAVHGLGECITCPRCLVGLEWYPACRRGGVRWCVRRRCSKRGGMRRVCGNKKREEKVLEWEEEEEREKEKG